MSVIFLKSADIQRLFFFERSKGLSISSWPDIYLLFIKMIVIVIELYCINKIDRQAYHVK